MTKERKAVSKEEIEAENGGEQTKSGKCIMIDSLTPEVIAKLAIDSVKDKNVMEHRVSYSGYELVIKKEEEKIKE